jgi:hypothetical protein
VLTGPRYSRSRIREGWSPPWWIVRCATGPSVARSLRPPACQPDPVAHREHQVLKAVPGGARAQRLGRRLERGGRLEVLNHTRDGTGAGQNRSLAWQRKILASLGKARCHRA